MSEKKRKKKTLICPLHHEKKIKPTMPFHMEGGGEKTLCLSMWAEKHFFLKSPQHGQNIMTYYVPPYRQKNLNYRPIPLA